MTETHLRAPWPPLAVVFLALAAGCGTGEPAATYPDPTQASQATDSGWSIDVLQPLNFQVQTTPLAAFVVRTALAGASAESTLEWALDGAAYRRADPAPERSWTFEVALLHGPQGVRIRASTPDSSDAPAAATATSIVWTATYEGEQPGVRIVEPVDAVGPTGARPRVLATAAPGRHIDAVEARLGDGAWAALVPETTANAWIWGGEPLGLDTDTATESTLQVRVTDDAGRETLAAAALRVDAQPPNLELDVVAPLLSATEPTVHISGLATDDGRLREIRISLDDSSPLVLRPPESTTAYSFATDLVLEPGRHQIAVTAVDSAGNEATMTRDVYRARRIWLGPPVPPPEFVQVSLGRDAIANLVSEQQARDLQLIFLDLQPLLDTALDAVRRPEEFQVDTDSWGPAEWNLHGMLTMTPDTVALQGTSLASLTSLSQNLGIAVASVLSDLTQVSISDPFLNPSDVAQVVFANLLATHPALVEDPSDGNLKLPISLWDVLTDLVELGERLGPVGNHPGVVSAVNPTTVLEPHFAMHFRAKSRLVEFQGVNLSGGKSKLFRRPADGSAVLDFDFEDPTAYDAVGIRDEPMVSLTLRVEEHAGYIEAGDSKNSNASQGFYKGNSAVWGLDPWVFERVVADAAFEAFHDLYASTGFESSHSYSLGAVEKAASWTWDRGWLELVTAGGIGQPPPPQYVWDALLEIAQVRLHDGGLAEGEANLELKLDNLVVALTADALVEATRPILADQEQELVDVLVGEFGSYESACDFVAAPAGDGWNLEFTSGADIPAIQPPHAMPGFYSSADFSSRISAKSDAGRQIIAAEPGHTLYAQDLDRTAWRVEVIQVDDSGVLVELTPAEVAP